MRYADNIVELMVGKLTRLPAPTQEALKELALLGNVAATSTLALVGDQPADALDAALLDTLCAGLVFRSDGAYAFAHDRIQEAAYSLIPESERAAEHLRIGRLFASRTAPREIEEKISEIVNQFNRGAELITLPGEREGLAELNLIGAPMARCGSSISSIRTFVTGKTNSGDALVAVRDSGPGLAPAALERLFEAFHTTKPNGLGLGLSICRSIIEAHGGRLWPTANAPRGAVFQFRLPANPDIASRQ